MFVLQKENQKQIGLQGRFGEDQYAAALLLHLYEHENNCDCCPMNLRSIEAEMVDGSHKSNN